MGVQYLPDQRVELLVQDNGPGINAHDQNRIFERFYRVERSNSGVPGCGLGLTIVQHVADLHHAEVSVGNSDFGSGVAFRIVFPPRSDEAKAVKKDNES